MLYKGETTCYSLIMNTDTTIKVSKKSYEMLRDRKERLGIAIRFSVERALELLEKAENNKKK